MKRVAFAWALGLCLFPLSAAAGGIDGSKPLLCAVTEAVECGFDGTCERGTADSINVPQFIEVDLAKEELRDHEGSRATKIRDHQRAEGRLVLQGIEQDRAWSIFISEKTGKMSVTATGREAGFVVFGACTEL
jgi:hypothetical protein